jgi:deazaflavin-dependent oxidoreductase (nitroreductase family)
MACTIIAVMVHAVVIGWLFRFGSDRTMDGIKAFNKHLLNPLMLRLAGRKGFYAAALHHVGRKSGNPYATPVRADPTPDGFVIPLPYGTNVDWLKNVLAEGSAELVTGGIALSVDRPEVVTAVAAGRHLPVWIKRQLDRQEVSEYLRLYVADSEPQPTSRSSLLIRDTP